MKNWISKRYKDFSPEKFDELLNKQGAVCAICKFPETKVKNGNVVALAIDHCHITGKVRGLLCNRCNTGLGLFKDNPLILETAIRYLNNANR